MGKKMSDMIDYLGELFIRNIFTERILHDCLQGLLCQPSDLRVEAAAYLLHIVEPAIEYHLNAITQEPTGVQGRLYLSQYYDCIEYWCMVGQMDAPVRCWILVRHETFGVSVSTICARHMQGCGSVLTPISCLYIPHQC